MTPGGLLVDKPEGPTSHDVVDRVRRLARERRCGHTGTLDPLATGLMVLLLGRATRLARFVSGADKTYLADLRFGFATDTYDRTGSPTGPVTERSPRREELERVLSRFQGAQDQVPPPFSAKRVAGKRSHRLAREGIAVTLEPVRVEIRALRLLEFRPPFARVEVSVSSGTYIRSLAHDLGQVLGVGAHLDALRRTCVGSFRVEDALDLEALSACAAAGELLGRLLGPEELLRDLPAVEVDAGGAERLVHGLRLGWEAVYGAPPAGAPAFRVLGPEGRLVAVGGPASPSDGLRTLLVWARPSRR